MRISVTASRPSRTALSRYQREINWGCSLLTDVPAQERHIDSPDQVGAQPQSSTERRGGSHVEHADAIWRGSRVPVGLNKFNRYKRTGPGARLDRFLRSA